MISKLASVAAAAVMVLATASPAGAAQDLNPGAPVYLALGDSWTYGQGAADPATGGYVARAFESLQAKMDCSPGVADDAADGCRHLQLVNLGRPGTAAQPGVTAPLVAAEQLLVALPMLEQRNGDTNPRNDVEVISLHVGGNDVSGPIQAACIGGMTQGCVITWMTEMAQFEADLSSVVAQLRDAAGTETSIVLGTYDNPVPFCHLAVVPGATTLGALVLEGTPNGFPIVLDGIHDVVRRVASHHGATVAEVFGSLGNGDFVGGADCLHVTDAGHAKVAQKVVDAAT